MTLLAAMCEDRFCFFAAIFNELLQLSQDAEVLQQDLQADEDQDGAAYKFRAVLVPRTEQVAHEHTGHGDGKRGTADEGGRGVDGDGQLHHGEADAYGQRVDAGGDGQHQKLPVPQLRRLRFLLFLLCGQALADHAAADPGQQHKGDPRGHLRHAAGKLGPQQPSGQGHDGLKHAEIQADEQGLLPVHPGHGQSLTDGHGEGVHAQAHAHQENLHQCHRIVPLPYKITGTGRSITMLSGVTRQVYAAACTPAAAA